MSIATSGAKVAAAKIAAAKKKEDDLAAWHKSMTTPKSYLHAIRVKEANQFVLTLLDNKQENGAAIDIKWGTDYVSQQWHYVLTDQKIKLAADTDFVVTLQDGNIVLAKSLKKDEEGYDFQRWDFKDWTLTSKGDHKSRQGVYQSGQRRRRGRDDIPRRQVAAWIQLYRSKPAS